MQTMLPETNQDGLDAIARAEAITITSREEYAAADAFCVGLKELERKVDEAYDEHIDDAYKAHKSLVAKKKTYAQPIEAARRIIKTKLIEWQEIEEKKRLEDEAALRAQARKRADDEALARAQEAQDEGQHEKADAIISEPAELPAIVIPKDLPKTSTTIQTRWDYRVTDMAAVPREFLMLDTVKLGQVVRAMKGETRIAGIEAYSKKV